MNLEIEELKKRILILNEQVWEGRISWPKIEEWLANFTGLVADTKTEQLHALYWLSQFMYFGGREIRVLLQSVYRDLYLCPMIQDVKSRFDETLTELELKNAVEDEIRHTRFIGVGNPSESGVHLLYYFRQENNLGKKQFIDAVQIFSRSSDDGEKGFWKRFITFLFDKKGKTPNSNLILRDPDIRRYVFLDDICGSGDTAISYSKQVLGDLLRLNPNAHVAYYSLFSTDKGLSNIKTRTLFKNNCAAVYQLDDSYKCLSAESRYLKNLPSYINPDIARNIAIQYGNLLDPDYAFGYKNGQMLMGFHHNTPDNTLGIMWLDEACGARQAWMPIFKRYPKIYGESV